MLMLNAKVSDVAVLVFASVIFMYAVYLIKFANEV